MSHFAQSPSSHVAVVEDASLTTYCKVTPLFYADPLASVDLFEDNG